MSDLDLDELREELEEYAQPQKKGGRSPREERVLAGFEEIQRFVEKHGRAPQHGEERDIFERLYAVRLDRLRLLPDCRELLAAFDRQGLLGEGMSTTANDVDAMDDDELLAELGEAVGSPDITQLRHVRSSAEKRAAEEIANRQPCEDFELFEPLFQKVQSELNAGLRQTRPFERKSEIAVGRFYILGGQKAYVAAMDEPASNEHGYLDARMRVIFDNGTESNLLMRSLQRGLQKDEAGGRRITEPIAGPLFADQSQDGDEASGTVYVLRSKSDHPLVAANRDLVHKIGVTGGSIERRVANARLDPTFLMADVDIVATYELYNISRSRLEHLIHKVFAPARFDIEVTDRFGNPVVPREWFLVPLFAVNDAIERIRDGSIIRYVYDPSSAHLISAVN